MSERRNADYVPHCVDPFDYSFVIANPTGPVLRLLQFQDGGIGFEHRCDRGERGVIVCAPRLQLEGGHTFDAAAVTVSPSILCPDCGIHGFVRDGRWLPA